MSNTNHLLTPTHKYTEAGSAIYKVTPVIYDAWVEVCDKMDWNTWINFCVAYPQFELIRHETKINQLLKLGRKTELNHTLLRMLEIAGNVSIEDGREKRHLLMHKVYERLPAIEKLTITGANRTIYYIKSNKIRDLSIQYSFEEFSLDPTVQDYARQILENNTGIESYSQKGGGLYVESINALFRGSIRTLSLEDVELTDYNNFLEKISLTNSLETIKIRGNLSKKIQKKLLNAPQACKQKIKNMTLGICHLPITDYDKIKEFKSLESIKIYCKLGEMRVFYHILDIILDMNSMKKVELQTIYAKNSKLLDSENESIMIYYLEECMGKNIDLILHPIQHDRNETFIDILMEMEEE